MPQAPYTGIGSTVDTTDAGDRVLLSSSRQDAQGLNIGASLVFRRTPAGWIQEAALEHPQPAPFSDNGFGSSESISADGSYAVVGSYYDSATVSGGGAAFVFVRSGTSWSLQQRIEPDDVAHGDLFGHRCDISPGGELAVVTSWLDDDQAASSGSAYVFERSGTTWSQTAKLTAPDLGIANLFGEGGVAITADMSRILVGCFRCLDDAGAAYVFERSGTSWVQEAKLVSSNPTSFYFGYSVAIDATGSRALLGSKTFFGTMGGTVTHFERSGPQWTEVAEFNPPEHGYGFGDSVALNDAGTVVLIGAPKAMTPDGASGAAYVYADVGGSWVKKAKVYTTPAPPNADYAEHVAMSDDVSTLLMGGVVEFLVSSDAKSFRCGGSTYCSAKTDSQGCTPTVLTTGVAALGFPADFVVEAQDVLNGKNGLLFYGAQGATSVPFLGGTLCVQPPLRRTPVQNSGGNVPPAQDCSGTLSFDMRAWIDSGIDPLLAPGAFVHCQFWYRDPQNLDGTGVGLSDATMFEIWP